MISKTTIDKVYDAIRVEEVIGDFIQLKRSGSNYKGLSPFSNERTPSFMVSPAKQIWKDFSSGKGGNAIAFLMEHEHFSYLEAIRYLAKKYQIEVEETQLTSQEKEKADEKESMFLVSEFAQKYFHKTLTQTDLGQAIGLSYFKERGFTNATIEKFQLGYCLDQWSGFTSEALSQGYQLSFLEKTGLTIVKDDKQFDRFKGRVMFPIHSMSGRVLGFGGRILGNDKNTAKYLNSPESDIYHKSKILYGIFQAKQAISKADNCYLVEGYTDVIQFHQAGIENVVASSGTALTIEQIRLINRLTKNVTILYDGDSAGLRASLRGIDLILEQGMNVRICTFPEGEDPDSFARKNANEDIIAYLEKNTQDFIRFKASLLFKETQNDPIKRSETIRDIVSSIAKIPDVIQQEIYVQECALLLQISEKSLFDSLHQITKREIQHAEKQLKKEKQPFTIVRNQPSEPQINYRNLLEKDLIANLVLHGHKRLFFDDIRLVIDENGIEKTEKIKQEMYVFEKIFLELQADETEFSSSFFQEIYNLVLAKFQQEPSKEIKAYGNEFSWEIMNELVTIFADYEQHQLHRWLEEKEIVVKDKDHYSEVAYAVQSIIFNLRKYFIAEKIKALQQHFVENTTESKSSTEIMEMIIQYISLQKILRQL